MKAENRLLPWAAGLLTALAFCSGYLLMPGLRGAWRSHYPELSARWSNDGRFTLIGRFGTELDQEELAYAARVNSASRSLLPCDPYVKGECGARQRVNDSLTYGLMGALKAVLRDISRTWLAARFLCCLLWVVLVTHLVRKAGVAPAPAVFFGVFIACFSYTLTFLFLSNLSWHGGLGSILAHNLWTVASYGRTESVLRLPRPGLTYLLLFLASWAAIHCAEKEGRGPAVLAGALGGALAYVRLDVWSAHLLALYAFAALRSWQDRRLCRSLLGAAALMTVLSLPFLWCNMPMDPEVLLRADLPASRRFDPWSLGYLAVFLLGLRHGRGRAVLYFSCMAAAAFAMVNVELVTGHRMQPEHWRYFANIYVFLLAASFLPRAFAGREGPWLAAAAALALAAMAQSVTYAARHFPFQGLPKDYEAALDWLDRGTPPDSVVLTLNPEVDMLIPVFTHDKVHMSFVMPVVSDFPAVRNVGRLFSALELLDADREKFLRECVTEEGGYDRHELDSPPPRGGRFEMRGLYQLLVYATPAKDYRELLGPAAGLAASAPPPDYVWFGHIEREYAGRAFLSRLGSRWKEVYRNPSVTLYRRDPAAGD